MRKAVPYSRRNAERWRPGRSGNAPRRARGARALWSERVLEALAEDFREHGPNEGHPLGLTKLQHANGKITYRMDLEGLLSISRLVSC